MNRRQTLSIIAFTAVHGM